MIEHLREPEIVTTLHGALSVPYAATPRTPAP
jgi:hypothetical protein